MKLIKYLDKKVQIVLINGFTYIGLVTDCDDNSITLIDKTNNPITLRESSINFIKDLG